jgi:hypothetical protein
LGLLQAVDKCLPTDDPSQPQPKDVSDRNQVHITNIDCQQVDDLSKWFTIVKPWYTPAAGAAAPGAPGAPAAPGAPPVAGAPGAAAAAPAAPGAPTAPGPGGPAESDAGPTGPGVIVQLIGHHYHNTGNVTGAEYLRNTLLKNLSSSPLQPPGSSYAVLLKPERIESEVIVTPRATRGATAAHGGGVGDVGGGGAPAEDKMTLSRFNFRIQFVWRPGEAAASSGPAPGGPPNR